MIRFAARQHDNRPNLSFQMGDAFDLKFANEFDPIGSFAYPRWVADHLSVLKAVRLSLVPGGRFHM